MVLDDPNAQPTRMKARKEPYVIDVEPGGHAMLFTDPRAGGKAAFKAVTGAFLGAAVAGAGGGSMLSGAVIGAGTGKSDLKHGYLEFNVNEGDILKISVKPLRNGNVKIKLIKD